MSDRLAEIEALADDGSFISCREARDLLAVARQTERLVASETDEHMCTHCDDLIEEDGRCSCFIGDLRAALAALDSDA